MKWPNRRFTHRCVGLIIVLIILGSVCSVFCPSLGPGVGYKEAARVWYFLRTTDILCDGTAGRVGVIQRIFRSPDNQYEITIARGRSSVGRTIVLVQTDSSFEVKTCKDNGL